LGPLLPPAHIEATIVGQVVGMLVAHQAILPRPERNATHVLRRGSSSNAYREDAWDDWKDMVPLSPDDGNMRIAQNGEHGCLKETYENNGTSVVCSVTMDCGSTYNIRGRLKSSEL
jgi:hypothetical protein